MSPDASSPSSAAPDRGSPFWRHVSRAVGRFDELLAFLAIPLLTSLMQFGNVERLLASGNREFSINLGAEFPSPVLDLWSFVDPPGSSSSGDSVGELPGTSPASDPAGTPGTGSASDGVTLELPVGPGEVALADVGFGLLAVLVPLLVAYAVVAAVVYAVYVGGIDRRLRGEPAAPLECVTRYAGRFLGYFAVLFAAAIAFVLVVVTMLASAPGATIGLIVFAIPAFLVLAYLFYAVPFLFVVADASLLESFGRSYRLAIDAGPYLTFALWHLGVTLVVSPLLSILVSPGGPVALLLGLAVTAPLSLVLTAATTSFLRELVEDERSVGDRRDDGRPAGSGRAAD
ncbi:hypothetical protein [Natronobeatus ordinarius]|uniref:hypothetical protein n=1 Tax=Natronobeatus ordinarius TaxID=2963433 RepID=UPI0020CF03A5|nr:hypothetical protein [Natronobeatus ordinarius]